MSQQPEPRFHQAATWTVVRLMKKQAAGLLAEGLLHSSARENFEILLETTSESPSESPLVLERAGALLLEQRRNSEFVARLASGLMETLVSLFWSETSEQLIVDTNCKFTAFGEFKRYASTLSFVPDFFGGKLPSIIPDPTSTFSPLGRMRAVSDFILDALTRLALEPARANAPIVHQRSLNSADGLSLLGTSLLQYNLWNILEVLNPPHSQVADCFSSVSALASYYAWVVAFEATIRSGDLFVPGVGSFQFSQKYLDKVQFTAEEQFWTLIKINAETPSLPDQETSGVAAA